MKKFTVVFIFIILIFSFNSAAIHAESTTTESAIDAWPDRENTQSPGSITPDSPLYALDQLIESVQVTFVFSPDKKAELLVGFANERLWEARLMTERNKQALVENVMKIYVKTVEEANKKLEEAAKEEKDVAPILESIKVVEDTAGKIVIKAEGMIPEKAAEEIKTAISNEVKKTLSVQAFAISKLKLTEANMGLNHAREELKLAREFEEETKIKKAEEQLVKTEQNKAEMTDLKEQVKEYKEAVKREFGEKGTEDKKDKLKCDKEKDCNNKRMNKLQEKKLKEENKLKKKLGKGGYGKKGEGHDCDKDKDKDDDEDDEDDED